MIHILNLDIMWLIFEYLEVNDKSSFSQLNRFFYDNFNPEIQKYQLINYVNKDYLKFYQTLNENNYENDIKYIDKVIAKTFMNIPTIKPSMVVEMYDLRYAFELIYNGYCPNDSDIRTYNIHFYIHFYKKIKNCIVNNRKLTIKNIEKNSYLFSLKQAPKFKEKNDWTPIHKE